MKKFYLMVTLGCLTGYVWIVLNFWLAQHQWLMPFHVCLFKNITSLPCPSCGSTRSIMMILGGHISDGLALNPLGVLILTLMLLLPLWLLYDFIKQRISLFNFYSNIERYLATKKYVLALFFVVLVNWIWNIYKGV